MTFFMWRLVESLQDGFDRQRRWLSLSARVAPDHGAGHQPQAARASPNRGKDAHYCAPAQNRTCGFPAYGSHPGYLTAKRSLGHGWVTRGSGSRALGECLDRAETPCAEAEPRGSAPWPGKPGASGPSASIPGVRELRCAGGYRALYEAIPDTGRDETAGDVQVLPVFGPGQSGDRL